MITGSNAIRFLLQTVLQEKYHTLTAADAGEAMQWLSVNKLPDAIILDSTLPDMESWELVEYFRTSHLFQHLPLIVISSLPEDEILFECERLGVNAWFRKPFNPIDLTKKLESLLHVASPAGTDLLKVV